MVTLSSMMGNLTYRRIDGLIDFKLMNILCSRSHRLLYLYDLIVEQELKQVMENLKIDFIYQRAFIVFGIYFNRGSITVRLIHCLSDYDSAALLH